MMEKICSDILEMSFVPKLKFVYSSLTASSLKLGEVPVITDPIIGGNISLSVILTIILQPQCT